MSEWKKVKLGELCDFINGGAWSDKEYVSEGIPVLKVTNCKVTGFVLDDLSYLPESSKDKYSQNELQLHDVIIATVGSHPNLVNSAAGRSVIVNSIVVGFYLNQNAVCIRTKDANTLNQLFFGYYSKYYLFQNYIQMRGKGAANQMRIAISAIKDYPMPIPPISIQNQIATILSRYDTLIENYQKQIKLLEEAAQRLYKEWFVELRFPGYENVKMVDGLPEGWEYSSITDNRFFSFAKCRILPFEGEKTYYATADVEGTYFCNNGIAVDYENKPSRAQIQPSCFSVWFARMSNSYKIIGFTDQNNGRREESLLSSGFAGFECDYERFGFLYTLISSQWFNDQKDRFATGATQVSITNEGLSRIKILVPTTKIVEEFSKITNKMIEESILYREKCAKLSEARDRLLPRLMGGEMEV